MRNKIFNYLLLSILCFSFYLPYVGALDDDDTNVSNFNLFSANEYNGCKNSDSAVGNGTIGGENCSGNVTSSDGQETVNVFVGNKFFKKQYK